MFRLFSKKDKTLQELLLSNEWTENLKSTTKKEKNIEYNIKIRLEPSISSSESINEEDFILTVYRVHRILFFPLFKEKIGKYWGFVRDINFENFENYFDDKINTIIFKYEEKLEKQNQIDLLIKKLNNKIIERKIDAGIDESRKTTTIR